MNKEKVLHLTSRSDIGGGPKHLVDLVTALNNIDEIVSYIGAPIDGFFAKNFKEISKKFIELPHRKFSIIKFFQLLSFARNEGITIIHSHGRGAGIYSRLLKLFGFKVIHTFHGVHIENSITGRVKVLLDKFLKVCTDSFICVSDDEFKKAKECNFSTEHNTKVVHNGVNIHQITPALKNDNSKLIITSLSRLTYQKGIDILIENLRSSRSKIHSDTFEIHIYGDGEDLISLNKKIEEYQLGSILKLKGPTYEPIKILAESDIYLSSARWEGFPLSVLEALSTGLPCLLSKVVGHKDLPESTIEFYNLNDSDSFSNALNKLLDDKDYRKSLGEKSRQLAVEKYSSENMARKTQSLYEALRDI